MSVGLLGHKYLEAYCILIPPRLQVYFLPIFILMASGFEIPDHQKVRELQLPGSDDACSGHPVKHTLA
jgi:hypothetical protein